MMPGRRRGTWVHLGCVWLAAWVSPCAWSQGEQTIQYPLKLAFIYNLMKFVEWPPAAFSSTTAALVICIVGHDPFPEDAERELRSRTSRGRPVEIRKLTITDNPGVCHVVFISHTENKHAAGILTRAENTSVLTIGENQGFVERGGVVNLVIHDANVHFEINTGAAKRKHLTISSRLLSLARIVQTEQ